MIRLALMFAAVAGTDSPFGRVLDRYFGGRPDEATLRLLGAAS